MGRGGLRPQVSSPSHTSRITRDSSEKVGSRPDAACVTRAESGRSPGLHLGFSGMMLFPSGATCGQTMEVAWGVGTGQQDRLGYFHPRYHSRDRAGQRGVLTTAPPGLAPFLPPQSPNLAMSAPGNPTLAPAQLCSWPPPAAPVAGPRARAGAADTTTQLKLGPEPEGRAVTEGWGRNRRQEWRGLWLREGLVFGNLDCHHQGLCLLPQARVRAHTYTQDVLQIHINPPEYHSCGSTESKETKVPKNHPCVKS